MLKGLFQKWGLPLHIRVDNGKPFGDPQRSSVPELVLWLWALGVKVIWNPPRTPRRNAKVERMQRTTALWAELPKCSSGEELQQKLDDIAKVQRRHYALRRLKIKHRRQHLAPLWNNPRHYHCDSFDVQRTYRYLEQVLFKRKVNQGGFLTFYAQSVYVGILHKGTTVSIRFKAKPLQFEVTSGQGQPIGHFTADNFSQTNIKKLTVCQHRSIKCHNFMSQNSTQT